MSLPGLCPACGAAAPIEAFLDAALGRTALSESLKLWPPELAVGALGYFGLFAASGKRVSSAKLARILGEFVELVRSGQVTRNRETRPAPLAAWAGGLEEIQKMNEAGTLQRPLSGHGLLCEIVHRRASVGAAKAQAASRPLHPSHRPAVLPSAEPLDPSHQPAPTRAERSAARASGVKHVGALLQALKGVPAGNASDRPDPGPDPDPDPDPDRCVIGP